MKYAWIENNIVRDVCQGIPDETYTPVVAAHYDTEIPDEVTSGATKIDNVWTNHTEAGPIAVPELDPIVVIPQDILVSPIEFKLLFTSSERIAIKTKRATDAILDDFYSIVDDPRLTSVNLSLQSTKDAVAYLEALKLITKERGDIILAGVVV